MDIHILCYGLGNQLSQYASFLNKKGLNQKAHCYYAFKQHNGFELDRIFGLKENLPWYLQFVRVAFRMGISRRFYSARAANFVLSLLRIKIIVESPDYQFDPALSKPWFGIRILFGGWHHFQYFLQSQQLIRETYVFPELDNVNLAMLKKIDEGFSVSIHVRRGDYLKGKNLELFGNIATVDYYRNAIAQVVEEHTERGSSPTFFIFSDDIPWCIEHLHLIDPIFVNINSGLDSWKDLALMARCKVNIIANSTFSWWGAWLNSNPEKLVLCPAKFISTDTETQTIYPPSWLRVKG